MKKQCKKHPKYNGKKEPKYKVPCSDCIAIYFLLHKKPRLLPKPTKVFKDKSKYTRKSKHNNGEKE